MWTLVIFTLLFASNGAGGTSTNVSTIQFQSQGLCQIAKNQINFRITGPAIGQVMTYCFQTS